MRSMFSELHFSQNPNGNTPSGEANVKFLKLNSMLKAELKAIIPAYHYKKNYA